MTTCSDLVELVRAPAALSVPGDALVGAAATDGVSVRTAGLAAASVCLYWAGMAANDWADRDVDAEERPHRPIPSGRVSPGAALGLAAGLTASGCAIAGFCGGRRGLATAALLAGTAWAYDTGLKNTALGPAAMAACRGLDVLVGANSGPSRRAVWPVLAVTAHTYTVTALSRRETQGSSSLLPLTTLLGTGAVALLAATSTTGGSRSRRLMSAVLAGAYAAQYGRAQLRAAADPSALNLRRAVGAGITGLPTLQGALAAGVGLRAGAAAALALAAPVGRKLAARTEVT